MKKTKSSKKVTNLAFAESPSVGISMKNGITSLVLLAKSSTKQRATKVKQKKPKTKVAPCTIALDYRTPSIFQPRLSLKPSLNEVDQIIAATYDILNKAEEQMHSKGPKDKTISIKLSDLDTITFAAVLEKLVIDLKQKLEK